MLKKKTIKKFKSLAREVKGRYGDLPEGTKIALLRLEKELEILENHHSNEAKNKNKRLKGENIQLGCGKTKLKGFINIDAFPPADLICDLRKGIPLDSDSANLIFSEHFLEHIDYPVSVEIVLKECLRVLKSGGQLIIGLPDTRMAVQMYWENYDKLKNEYLKKWYSKRDIAKDLSSNLDLLNYHFRDQDNQKYNPHFWSYDRESLSNFLEKIGFVNISEWKFDDSIANKKREFGSFYLSCYKVSGGGA